MQEEVMEPNQDESPPGSSIGSAPETPPAKSIEISEGRSADERVSNKMDGTKKLRVLHSFMLKKVVDDHEIEGSLVMIGTFIQRVFGLTEEQVDEMVKDDKAFFNYRFNECTAGDDNVHVRRTEKIEMSEDGIALHGCKTIVEVRIPLEMDSFLSAFPFQVSLASASIELSSRFVDDDTVRPDLLLHKEDPRYAFALQNKMDNDVNTFVAKIKHAQIERFWTAMPKNWRLNFDYSLPRCSEKDEKELQHEKILNNLDKTKGYEFLSPYPEISFRYNPKKDYCARFKVQFYVVNPGFQKMVTIVLPMVLVSFLAILNVVNDFNKKNEDGSDYQPLIDALTEANATEAVIEGVKDAADAVVNAVGGEDAANHLQVTSALTLTIVFVLPLLLDDQGNRDRLLTKSNGTIIFFFFGLILASVPNTLSVGGGREQVIGIIFMSASALFMPLYNWLEYAFFQNGIKAQEKEQDFFVMNSTHQNWKPTSGLDDFFTVGEYLKSDKWKTDETKETAKPVILEKSGKETTLDRDIEDTPKIDTNIEGKQKKEAYSASLDDADDDGEFEGIPRRLWWASNFA